MSAFGGLVALVTGAASGIGAATVDSLEEAGARVGALDIEEASGRDGVLPLVADVTDGTSIDAAVQQVVGEFGRLDVLVNVAGIGAAGTIEDNSDDEWRQVFDVNVLGMVRTARAALPHLRRAEHPAVVNVSSVAAIAGLPQRALYSASKGAVLSLTLAMAADLVDEGIRVNCICPGTADTPWVGRLLDAAPDPGAERAALEARQPMGRLGSAQEIAAGILFLAAPTSSFVTGTALEVDGGMAGLRIPARPQPG
ncbi:MAG: SDR family oxidoreductase [Actinobacteria bacterium]|nr:SDR family oxidoreductase [Actinomycetota bacterium]MDQ3531445.1 SDR family oxidoreductase [Actinomycetota bacterium]